MRLKTGFKAIKIKGFFRVQIVDKRTHKVVGDSGYIENQITNYGLNSCFCAAPIGANSVQAAGIMLGSGTNPASSAVALPGSLTAYYSTFGQKSVISSTQARVTQSFDGTLGAATLANFGLFAASSGSLLCGMTYDSSAIGTDQDVNVSYALNYTAS